jgi:hypothetical protein
LWVFAVATVRRLVTGVSGPHCTERGPDACEPGTSDGPSVDSISWAVAAASRFVPYASCLTQALVVERFMRRAGFDPTLRIGVARTSNGTMEAHAWIEHDGRVVIGEVADIERFTVMPEFPDRP